MVELLTFFVQYLSHQVSNINFGNKAWCQKYCIPWIWFIISKLYCCYCCSFYHASGYHSSTSNLPTSFFAHSRQIDINITSVVHNMHFTGISYSTLFSDITNSTDRNKQVQLYYKSYCSQLQTYNMHFHPVAYALLILIAPFYPCTTLLMFFI